MTDSPTNADMNVKYEEEEKKEVAGLDDESGIIKLEDKYGNTFEVQREYAKISKLLVTMFEHDNSKVQINTVEPKILKLVIDYLVHHKGVEPPIIEKPLRSKNMKDVCKDPWDADFIDEIGKNLENLYAVILAANYFDIKSLLHLGSAKVASLIKGEPLNEIKNILLVNSQSSPTVEEKKE